MTRDASIEASSIVDEVYMALAGGQRDLAVRYVKSQLERFELLGQQKMLEEFKQRFPVRAA